jgi:type IV pilus assembly protein PilF
MELFRSKRRVGTTSVLCVLTLWLAACATSPNGIGQNDGVVLDVPTPSQDTDERRHARIRLELGINYYQAGQYVTAIDELRQAIKIDSQFADPYAVMGLVFMDLGDVKQAEANFVAGLRVAPRDPDLNINYGWFLCQNQQVPAAIERFKYVLRNPLVRNRAKPLQNLGVCSIKVNDVVGAEDYFAQALQFDASNSVALQYLTEIALKRQDIERAKVFADRLLFVARTPDHLWLGVRVLRAANMVKEERDLARNLRQNFPESKEAQWLSRGEFQQSAIIIPL